MTTIKIEFLGHVHPYIGAGIEIFTAMLLGGIIGYEREKRMKPAGIKTNILICLGATLYTFISILNQEAYSNGHGVIDPNRVAAQIVSGIGFLGAGAILQSRGEIVGLTTAATIWVVAALGFAIGSGHPVIAAVCTLTVIAVLELLTPLYRLIGVGKEFHLQVFSAGSIEGAAREVLNGESCQVHKVEERVMDKETDRRILLLTVSLNPKYLKTLIFRLQELDHVYEVSVEGQKKNGGKKMAA